MNTILKSVNPEQLITRANVRSRPPMPNGTIDPDLSELVESVRMFGVMQPITVGPLDKKANGYPIIYGHRRAEAARLAKLPAVPVIVQEIAPDEVVARQLIENIQRQALDLADTAAGVRALYEAHGVVAIVAEMVGKAAAWVSKMLTVTAPGKSSHAQHLLKCDRLHDLDMAYLLCRVESLSMSKADELAHRIFHDLTPKVTRDTLKQAIVELEKQATKVEEDESENTSPAPAPAPSTRLAATFLMTEPERMMLQNALDAYTVSPAEHGLKIGLLAKLRA